MGHNARKKSILFFGYGYTAQRLYQIMDKRHWNFYASIRNKISQVSGDKVEFLNFDNEKSALEKIVLSCDAMMISIPPSGNVDPVLEKFDSVFQKPLKANWIGYLSATSVYGDFKGNWVSEATKPEPTTIRGIQRLLAENKWKKLANSRNLPVFRFRISGIYGPGRSPFMRIVRKEQKVVQKANQIFNRIHVDDLCEILYRTMTMPVEGRLFNISDNTPSTSEDFLDKAADLISYPKLERIPFDMAQLSEMAHSFYADSKKVSNKKVVKELNYEFKFPSYIEGLTSILDKEKSILI